MRKLLAVIAGLVLALGFATGVFAWGNISLTAKCMPDDTTLAWTIHLPSENNFKVDWSFDADFSAVTTVDFGSAGDHDFTTPDGGSTLYVRWSSDHQTTAQADSNHQACVSASSVAPTPEGSALGGASTPSSSPEGGVQGGVGTPGPALPDTSVPADQTPGPIPAIAFAVLLLVSLGGLAVANVRAR